MPPVHRARRSRNRRVASSRPCSDWTATKDDSKISFDSDDMKPRRSRLHYAWVMAGITFVVLLMTAGIRATPGILIIPLETEFQWSRTAISAAVAINIALFGLIGPFAASLMDRWGVRRVVLGALSLV